MKYPKITDSAGRPHLPAPTPRILSLVPSLTELVFDLGLGDYLVGRTAFCVHPANEIKKIKSVGGTKQVNWTKVEAAAPTHALVNIDENPKELAEALEQRGIEVIVTHPISPSDNIELFKMMGALFERETAANQLIERFLKSQKHLTAQVEGLPNLDVLYLIWQAPHMTVSRDTYISKMLASIGWRTLGHDETCRYPEVAEDSALFNQADKILFATEPFPFKQQHLDEFANQHPKLKDRLMIVDGEMLSWYGSRAINGLSYLTTLADHTKG